MRMTKLWVGFLLVFISHQGQTHSLPDTEIILKQTNDTQLSVLLRFALDDLLIAAHQLKPLAQLNAEQNVSQDIYPAMDNYLQQHWQMHQDQAPLETSLVSVSVVTGYNHHVGSFRQVEARYLATLVRPEALPLKLNYDAIIHEIRSHTVSVYWIGPHANQTLLARFGYHQIAERPQIILTQ